MKAAASNTSSPRLSDKALSDLRAVMDTCGMESETFTDDDLNYIGTLLLTVRLVNLKIEHRLNNTEEDGIIDPPGVCSPNTKN